MILGAQIIRGFLLVKNIVSTLLIVGTVVIIAGGLIAASAAIFLRDEVHRWRQNKGGDTGLPRIFRCSQRQGHRCAKRLTGAASLLDRVAAECDRARRRLIVSGRARLRSDARKNVIVAYLLGLKAPGRLDAGTLEQVQTDIFASRTMGSGKAAMSTMNSIS